MISTVTNGSQWMLVFKYISQHLYIYIYILGVRHLTLKACLWHTLCSSNYTLLSYSDPDPFQLTEKLIWGLMLSVFFLSHKYYRLYTLHIYATWQYVSCHLFIMTLESMLPAWEPPVTLAILDLYSDLNNDTSQYPFCDLFNHNLESRSSTTSFVSKQSASI